LTEPEQDFLQNLAQRLSPVEIPQDSANLRSVRWVSPDVDNCTPKITNPQGLFEAQATLGMPKSSFLRVYAALSGWRQAEKPDILKSRTKED
jgi:hypothetical protein